MRRPLLPLLLLLAMLAFAACDGASTPTGDPSPTDDAVPSATAEESIDAPSDEPAPSDTDEPEPTESDEPEPTESDEPEPTDDDASAEPTASDGSGSADACTGNDDNRLFYAKVATAVDWPVYCPVLPSGWFVASGEYKSAGGGWMTIAYRGPGGARLELGEGFFCSDAGGCVPDGSDSGAAAFGGLEGTLITGSDGTYAVVVDRGSSPSWVATGIGLDVDGFTGLVADFFLVEG
jgi:hypothetical protein